MGDALNKLILSSIEEAIKNLSDSLGIKSVYGISIEKDRNFPYVAEYELVKGKQKITFNARNITKSANNYFEEQSNDDFTDEDFAKMIIIHELGHALDPDFGIISNLESEISKTEDIEKYFMAQFLIELNAWEQGKQFCDSVTNPFFDRVNAFNLERKFNEDIKKKWDKEEELHEFLIKLDIKSDFANYSNTRLAELRTQLNKELFEKKTK